MLLLEVKNVRWKGVWAFFLFLLILVSSVLVAAESSVVVTPVKNQVRVGEEAIFNLTITNNLKETQKYSLYSFVQGWSIDPFPLSDKILELGPGKSYITSIRARALDDFYPGIYYVSVNIESDHGERRVESLKIYLSPEQPVDYLPSIKVQVDMDEKINPQQPLSIRLFLENKNPLDLNDLVIKLQSDMSEFVKEVTVSLPPLQKKTVEFTVTPHPLQQPKQYVLFFVFERQGQTVKVIDKKVDIIPLVLPFEVSEASERRYLNVYRTITVTNKGNVLNTQDVTLPSSFLEVLFMQGEATGKTENGQRSLVFQATLAPGEKTNVSLVTQWRILAYIIGFLVLFGLFYWYVQPPVSVKKTALISRMDGDDALSEVKVTLEVKNRSRKPLKNVEIVDVIPAIADLEKSLQVGTLKPTNCVHTKHGTKVHWQITELDGYEHRLITYKLKAKLNILGIFSLPRATAEFSRGKKRKGKAYSNVFRLGV